MPDHAGTPDARLVQIAEEAAERAVSKAFRRMRIKIEDDDAMDQFVDNQKFITQLRGGRERVAQGVWGVTLDLLKQLVRAVALAAVVAIGAQLGIHYQGTAIPPVLSGKQ